MNKKVILMILDGWGVAKNKNVSAVDKANTPFIDKLLNEYKHSTLEASGTQVGLPEGQMGNSEVGHINLGAGRVVYQNLEKINKAFKEKTILDNPEILNAISYAKEQNKPIHLMGLTSDGGVHAHINHLKGFIDLLENAKVDNYYVHAFTDGRDCDPHSGLGFLQDIEQHLEGKKGEIATIIGRYFAMDRDNRWERVKLAYDLLVDNKAEYFSDNLSQTIQEIYDNGTSDEFMKAIAMVDAQQKPIAKIQEDDVVICFNFRTDRGREITSALSQKSYPEHHLTPLKLKYLTMTKYDDSFKNIQVIFNNNNIVNTLGEVLEANNKKQIRIAETEKYPHVTFFFSGGREKPYQGEKRLLCPSPKVATYDLQPEMSAYEITDKIIPELDKKEADFICLNFANPDMVGHTGDMDAAIKACETVDKCTQEIIGKVLENDYSAIIIADHGNADCMSNPDGSPNTAHTTQPVPCIFVDNNFQPKLKNGKLGDIAPTVLKLIGINAPKEMTGNSLI